VKTLKLLVGGWLFLLVIVVGIAIADSPSDADPGPRTGQLVVSDLSQLDMLDSDQRMLQRMRIAETPDMVTMIETDLMWTDPDMIRRQEEYQAQLDRMIGRRPGQP